MKPDGVTTAALGPMETMESDLVNEAAPGGGPEPNQAASPAEEGMPQQPAGEPGQLESQTGQTKETPAAKPCNKPSGDSKAKTTNKATAKTKAGPASPTKTTSRPNTAQSRLSNGTSKPQTNGVAKKTAPPAAPVKKSTPTPALSKKPTTTVPASKTKVGEKKATGAPPATNGAKSMTGTTAAKKTASATANGVKTSASSTAAAAKKAPAPKPASATPTKPSSAASPKPAVSKTTRTPIGSAPSSRPATGATRPPSGSAAKSSPAAAKPAAPKTPSSTSVKPAASRLTSTTPSGGKPPASQTPRNVTPVKKDVTKPAASGSKKPADSPLTRPSATTKAAKPETPKSVSKSDVGAKKPAASKAADTKTPTRPKTDGKPTPSKTPGSKTAASKASTPKKTVGSSTPTPVKRGPKAETVEEAGPGIAAAVATAAAIATAAATLAGPEVPEPAVERSAAEAPELISSQTEAVQERISDPTPEPVREPTPEPVREPTPEPVREPTPEPVREPTPEPVMVPVREPTPEPVLEPVREPTPEPVREPTPEPVREPTPEPVREQTPEPVREQTPEPVREPSPERVQETSPEPLPEPLSQSSADPDLRAEPDSEDESNAQLDLFKFQGSARDSSLGTTVMSPPCSPPGPVSPVREPQTASSLLDLHAQSDPWDGTHPSVLSDFAPQNLVSAMNFNMEEETEKKNQFEAQTTREEKEEEEEDEEEEEEETDNLCMPTSTAPSAEAFNMMAHPHSPMDDSPPRDLMSPHDKEEAVEKADEEINEDDDEEDYEDEEQRRLGHQPLSFATDMSTSQPSEEFQARPSAFGGSAGWPGDDPPSGMDSEDVSSCGSSRQHGVSDLSSTQHTALLEGTQSSDALVDSSLRGSEGDANIMGSPNVETLANEEEEDEDEEDERVDDMDLSSERMEEHHKVFQQRERYEDDEDEDVEMHSEGVTESGGNVDEDDFNEEERLDNLNRPCAPACAPPGASSWGQTNPFSDPWAQPASLLPASSPSPASDPGAPESEMPILSPALPRLDGGAPAFAPESEHESAHEEEMKCSASQSGAAPASRSSSETSTPEELRDYDSSSGVESRSEKRQTPVPASVQPDMEQDLGIHLEKGDGEEEEAETLPADEVPGTGPPTAPASAPSSASTSGDEASDTEGEMQINDPDAPATMDQSAGFESPPTARSLHALDEDEEAADAPAGYGEEDGGGTTPQSANSVASYGFDCTTSNSNAHSMAESCGKSPGIFSLENEEQLPEEAKDPSLIKELTLPSAATAAPAEEDLLGRPVDLMPLGHPGDVKPSSLDEHHYMFGGKMAAADHLEDADPLEPSHRLGGVESGDPGDSQPPYYSTICDKTDSFLAGNV
ncbi:mucin-1 isoform X2 [Etheostoma cragini]|uniref:mucin-1 isoform X2 n=1 Tax=Etheostoma cragini TaxID=417921 RepID=UPI00155F4C26|nr:mucin-1 isoform X2 [Etheostoma cragini]